jgi:hypothetical protein
MIKSSTRIWFYIYFIFSFSIGTLILTKGQHGADTSVSSILLAGIFVILLTFGVPIWLVTRVKTIIIDNNGIKITFPFLLRNSYYYYSDIDYFATYNGVARGLSFQEMRIVLKNKKTLTITSAANTQFKEMDVFLRQKIEKKSI